MNSKIQNYILIGVTIIVIPFFLWKVMENSGLDLITMIGLFITALGLILINVARYQLGGSFSVTAQAKELVTRGLYSKIRHPVYVFGQLMLLGIILVAKQIFFFLPWALLLVMQILRSKREERVLEEKFGDAYREYKAKTWF